MKYIIGVDGGGTKTAAALADINGNVITIALVNRNTVTASYKADNFITGQRITAF